MNTTFGVGHGAKISVAAFSPDGARIVTASDDGTARVWELPLDEGSLLSRNIFALTTGIRCRGGESGRNVANGETRGLKVSG